MRADHGRRSRAALLLAVLTLAAACATAAPRSLTVRAQFQRANPCPSNGKPSGPCPGWQIDHAVALCAGGADAPANLQWLTVDEHRVKTRADRRACRAKPPQLTGAPAP